jgi:hypothetical protein
MLLGEKPSDDLEFAECAKDDGSGCVVILKDEFFRLKQDHLNLLIDLDACQRGRK